MRIAAVDILVLPGLGNSGPEHWQSRWIAGMPTARRVVVPYFDRPDRAMWIGALIEAASATDKPAVVVAHSIGVATVAHAAPSLPRSVRGAFLVGMSDWNRPQLLPGVSHDFAPMPRDPLPFPSMLIASRNDPYCDFDTAADFANAWGSDLVDAGEVGHINVDSGHGPWPEGMLMFARFLKRLGPADQR
ncbi:MAG: alpha/beta hydrolase [Alphaproteobacteria bacterium]|nr:alpha/beta hydrolase [Alphaproteobacteria bacterium]